MKPSHGVVLHELVDGRRRPSAGEPTNDCRPVTSMISSRIERFFGLRLGPPLVRGRDRVPVHPDAGPALGDGVLAAIRIDVGQRPVRVVGGQVAVPQLLQEPDRGLAADLLQPHLVGQFAARSASVSPRTNVAAGQDQELVAGDGRTGRSRPLTSV